MTTPPKPQRIKVKTKSGLIAAFTCAAEYDGPTDITLVTASGTTMYCIAVLDGLQLRNRRIKKTKAAVRKIHVDELLG